MPVACVLLTARLPSAVVAPSAAPKVTEPLPAVITSARAPSMVLLKLMLPLLLTSVLAVPSVTAPVKTCAPAVVSVPARVMPPVLESVSGASRVTVLTVIMPLVLPAPTRIRLNTFASAAMSAVVRSSAAVSRMPPSTMASVLVSARRLKVPLPLTVALPPLKFSSSTMKTGAAPALSVLLKLALAALMVLASASVTAPL